MFHQFDDQLNDHLVEPAGVERRHPQHRVADLLVVGHVGHRHLAGEFLQHDSEEVWCAELRHLLAGRLDSVLECRHEKLREEPVGRVDVRHDGVCLPTRTVELAHPHVDLSDSNLRPTRELRRLTAPTRHSWLGHTVTVDVRVV